jgi:hypothetical protein
MSPANFQKIRPVVTNPWILTNLEHIDVLWTTNFHSFCGFVSSYCVLKICFLDLIRTPVFKLRISWIRFVNFFFFKNNFICIYSEGFVYKSCNLVYGWLNDSDLYLVYLSLFSLLLFLLDIWPWWKYDQLIISNESSS